jgi:hypothetical protein
VLSTVRNRDAVRIEIGCLSKRRHRLDLAFSVRKVGGDRLEITHGSGHVADLDAGARGGAPHVEIRWIERSEADANLGRPVKVAAREPAFRDRVQKGPGIDEHALLRRHLARLQQGMLVVGPDLDDLLVERRGLGPETFAAEAVGNARELLDRLVALPGAHVEIAENVRGVPILRLILDDAQVLRDGRFELPLPEQLLGISQDQWTINRHVTSLRAEPHGSRKIREREAA